MLNNPFITYGFLTIQLVLFLMMTIDGGSTNLYTLIRYGAKFTPLILEGEWFRFVTPMFLHIGTMHLVMNSIILYYLGTQLENVYGHWRYFLIYILSGIMGNVASFAFSSAVSAGASTALFGLFASTIVLAKYNQRNPAIQSLAKNFTVLIVINLVFGLFNPTTDMAGHVGGLIGGYFMAHVAIKRVYSPDKLQQRIIHGGLFAITLGVLLYLGFLLN
ncbi:rhomboid family intramembrane serine protease [Lacticigenium naphthae]|uniref:rhomboid family intramembrane serine protease n=1 Tax=Lacticigenium naphthae TaxID=515351 RepID=UPI0012EBEAED|nr:rhomboid family intramembrane serine protease [Lacticigenium naphthae]